MTQKLLTQIISAAAARAGYAFHTGEMQTLSGRVRVYPATWLAPPVVKRSTGRTEGETTYRTTLHLMSLHAPDADVWATLERDALSVAADIALSDGVCSIANVACTPARQSLTAHGETSLTLECDVTLWYLS